MKKLLLPFLTALITPLSVWSESSLLNCPIEFSASVDKNWRIPKYGSPSIITIKNISDKHIGIDPKLVIEGVIPTSDIIGEINKLLWVFIASGCITGILCKLSGTDMASNLLFPTPHVSGNPDILVLHNPSDIQSSLAHNAGKPAVIFVDKWSRDAHWYALACFALSGGLYLYKNWHLTKVCKDIFDEPIILSPGQEMQKIVWTQSGKVTLKTDAIDTDPYLLPLSSKLHI